MFQDLDLKMAKTKELWEAISPVRMTSDQQVSPAVYLIAEPEIKQQEDTLKGFKC